MRELGYPHYTLPGKLRLELAAVTSKVISVEQAFNMCQVTVADDTTPEEVATIMATVKAHDPTPATDPAQALREARADDGKIDLMAALAVVQNASVAADFRPVVAALVRRVYRLSAEVAAQRQGIDVLRSKLQ